MPPRSWQLWLARDLVLENRLPWQSTTSDLTPGRVAQSMLSVLVALVPLRNYLNIGENLLAGKQERYGRLAPRYPTVKKRVSPRKKFSRLVV